MNLWKKGKLKKKNYTKMLKFFGGIMNKTIIFKGVFSTFLVILILSLFSCHSVFQGGTSGIVVDGESTLSPKAGIPNVDVYAYTSEKSRDDDYSRWQEGRDFYPAADYYGHTTTNSDGSFSFSKLLWKNNKPAFGKDGDVTKIYLLFYHENYGLTKGQSLIVSDSMSNTVYQELIKNRIVTTLNISFVDVATNQNTSNNIFVSISVPQTTDNNQDVLPKVFTSTISGSGRVQISYPRYKNSEDKLSNTENKPLITVKYYQNAQEETWKACFNQDNEDKNFAFRDDVKETGIDVEIGSGEYSLSFYGKATKLNMPLVSGQLNTSSTENGTFEDDGRVVSMKSCGSGNDFIIDCGAVSTRAETIGTSGNQKHGTFSGLGQGITWTDFNYTDKYAETTIKLYVDEVEKISKVVRSNQQNYTVLIQ